VSFVTYLECSRTGARIDHDRFRSISDAGAPLLVRYDLEALKGAITKEALAVRSPDMWRYLEFLPLNSHEDIISLGEQMTPLIPLPGKSSGLGAGEILVKDEGRLPTGSFKARGIAVAVSMAKAFGIKHIAMPTAGNAGAALAAYCSRAGIESTVFCPDDAPETTIREIAYHGAHTFRVNGLINHCGEIVAAGTEEMGWLDLSTLKEPYRIEGKKTMGLELAEQFQWELPDVILYPTGGGTGLIGMWKAFAELETMGWLNSEKRPRMVVVQSDGCCPIVRAFDKGDRFAELFENAHTIASGLRVPAAVGDFMILDAVRESGGCAVAVDENQIRQWMRDAACSEGISVGPESAACVGATRMLADSGWIKPDERVVIFNCGASQKYPDAMRVDLPCVDKDEAIDWDFISGGGVKR